MIKIVKLKLLTIIQYRSNVSILFNVKKFQKEYANGFVLTNTIKKLLLRALQYQAWRNAAIIKWNIPNRVNFIFTFFHVF